MRTIFQIKLKLFSFILLTVIICAVQFSVSAQMSIDVHGTTYTENFNSYTGTGFVPTPAAGQLDSDAWVSSGMSAGTTTFGSSAATADFARGSSTGAASTGGFYAFDNGAGDSRFMFQPTGGDFTPGTITLRLQNNTGSILTDLDISYHVYAYNDQARSNSITFSYSIDNAMYTGVGALDYASPTTSTGAEVDGGIKTTSISSLSIADAGYFYLRWSSNDVSGSGSRDQLMIDDVTYKSTTTTTSVNTTAVSDTLFCIDGSTAQSVNVDYTSTATFASGNVFTVELSDASGSFSSPVSIGSVAQDGINPAGTITASIPAGTAAGGGYRIRITSDNPVVTAYDNGSDLEVDDFPNEATGFSGSGISEEEIELSWTNPTSCFDEVLIVMCTSNTFGSAPTGDGSSYSSSTCGSGTSFDCGSIVYQGIAETATVSELTLGQTYYFRLYTRYGTTWSSGVDISANPISNLNPGDILIMGVNANNASCSGATGEDLVSFVAFEDIAPGTSFDITDNGWERSNANEFGDTEGTLRITRTTSTVSAGEVFILKFSQSPEVYAGVTVAGVADNNWTFTEINGSATFNLNSGGDQMFLMQGGIWDNNGGTGGHDATYDGRMLYGFNSRTTWSADGSTQQSNMHPSLTCLSHAPSSGTTDFFAYTGLLTSASHFDWIERIKNSTNWSTYTDCTDYNSNNAIPSSLTISSGASSTTWDGSLNSDWFNCANWSGEQVPNASVNVTIPSGTANEPEIDITSVLAPGFNNKAWVNNLTISGGVLTLEGSRTNLIELNGDFALTSGSLDMDDGVSDSEDGTIILNGNWTNVDESNFLQGESLISFSGISSQIIDMTSGAKEVFFDLQIDKPAQEIVLLQENIEIGVDAGGAMGTLDFICGGIIQSGSNEVYVVNSDPDAVTGFELPNIVSGAYLDDRYVFGTLSREVNTATTYYFAVGDDPAGEAYNPVSLVRTGGATGKVSCTFNVGIPGELDATTVISGGVCDEAYIDYSGDMAGEGWWNLSGPAIEYDIYLHHNAVNAISNPTGSGEYRVIKATAGTAGSGNSWAGFEAVGDPCEVGDWFNIPGKSLTGFSDFAPGGGGGGPLPIELADFEAVALSNKVELSWSTELEFNNNYFEVERCDDGLSWERIGKVYSGGDSYQTQEYKFIDRAPLVGQSYYRLVQTDFDGSFSYSSVEIVQIAAFSRVHLIPNPTSGVVQVSFELEFSEEVKFEIYNLTAKLLIEQSQFYTSGWMTKTLNLSALPSGTYFVRITSEHINRTEKLTLN